MCARDSAWHMCARDSAWPASFSGYRVHQPSAHLCALQITGCATTEPADGLSFGLLFYICLGPFLHASVCAVTGCVMQRVVCTA